MELTTFEEDRAALVAIAPVLRRLAARLDEASSAELGPLFAELDALKSAARGVITNALISRACGVSGVRAGV